MDKDSTGTDKIINLHIQCMSYCYYSMVIIPSLSTIAGDRPTMMELIRFRGRERRINIPQEISTKCHQIAVLLLEDSTGARIRSMEQKHSNSPEEINLNILEQWIEGTGRKPVTWRTLVEVLYDVQLITLADDIVAVKFPES